MRQLRTDRQVKRMIQRVKHSKNPLVPIVGERLKAARQLDGRSLEMTAQRIQKRFHISCTRQVLHHLERRGRGCRSALRRALADTLAVSEEWLGGEDLVATPGWLESERIVATAFGSPPEIFLRAELAARRFVERCRDPLRREHGGSDPEEIMGELVNPSLWRSLLLDQSTPEMSAQEIGELVPLIARCLEGILGPWFRRVKRRSAATQPPAVRVRATGPRLDLDRIREWVVFHDRRTATNAGATGDRSRS
jgi:hypothetical protein